MINQEFQELKGQWNANKDNANDIIDKMRNNLLKRNNNQERYTLNYISKGFTFNIKTATVEQLLEIDGDMCPLGK